MKRLVVRRYAGLIVLAFTGCSAEPIADGTTRPIGAGATAAGAGAGNSPINAGAGGSTAQPNAGGQNAQPTSGAGGAVIAQPTAGTTGGVPEVMGMRGSWPSFGGDLAHTRSSPGETMISKANAKDLKAAFDIKALGVTATPALYKGVIYWADWSGIVHATNLVDQRELWKLDRSAMGGGYTGSPFVTERSVYVANRNGLLTAIDRETGVQQWEVKLDAGVHTHLWSSPVVAEADNVLIIGVGGLGTRNNGVPLASSQLETFRGYVQGVDATTGVLLWKLDVNPEQYGAGVSVWSSAAIDTKRKLAFIGTGNNYYRPVSPYSDSLVAIDYITGTRKWHQQFTANDAWTTATAIGGGVDGDVGATPNLFTIGERDVVGVGDKPGRYHVHDRETGMLVWSQKLTNGGYQGGVMAPAAYQNGVVYVVSNNDTRSSTVFALNATTGVPLWETDLTDPTFGGPAIGNGVLYVGDQAGNMWALDAANGDELWTKRLPQGRGGGFSLVDGMLFTGYGFHFSESRREPLMGGLIGYSLTGTVMIPETPTEMSDCPMPEVAVTSAATFTNVYQGVLCPMGCTKVCHSSSMEAGLRLDQKAIAYQSLVGVAAKGEACKTGGHMLVVSGSPTSSLLHGKLAAMPACGVPMPPTFTAATTPVTPVMLEAVRAWIAAGAPNN